MTVSVGKSFAQERLLATTLVGLSHQPQRFASRTALLFVGFEAFLIIMHFAITGLFGDIANRTADGHIGGFDLNDEATIAVWFSSIQLLLISLCCWLNSFVDRGSIGAIASRRFWRFGFYLFLIMSVDETGGLHEIFGKAMTIVFPELSISPSVWWTIPYALCVAVFLLFLLCKLIREPGILLILAIFVLSWFVANALEHIHVFDMSVNFAIEEGLEMFGATMLLLALTRVFIKETRQLV